LKFLCSKSLLCWNRACVESFMLYGFQHKLLFDFWFFHTKFQIYHIYSDLHLFFMQNAAYSQTIRYSSSPLNQFMLCRPWVSYQIAYILFLLLWLSYLFIFCACRFQKITKPIKKNVFMCISAYTASSIPYNNGCCWAFLPGFLWLYIENIFFVIIRFHHVQFSFTLESIWEHQQPSVHCWIKWIRGIVTQTHNAMIFL
jgi:hypothetical protein